MKTNNKLQFGTKEAIQRIDLMIKYLECFIRIEKRLGIKLKIDLTNHKRKFDIFDR